MSQTRVYGLSFKHHYQHMWYQQFSTRIRRKKAQFHISFFPFFDSLLFLLCYLFLSFIPFSSNEFVIKTDQSSFFKIRFNPYSNHKELFTHLQHTRAAQINVLTWIFFKPAWIAIRSLFYFRNLMYEWVKLTELDLILKSGHTKCARPNGSTVC